MDSAEDDIPDSDCFLRVGMNLLHRANTGSSSTALRRFKSHYGGIPSRCALIWANLNSVIPLNCKVHHFLWGMMFSKF